MRILAGDIGGTKTDLVLFHHDGTTLRTERSGTYPSGAYAAFEEILFTFLGSGSESVDLAALGVAGPVLDGRCRTTNLPWILDSGELGRRFGISPFHLLNDLAAMAYGTLYLSRDDYQILNPGIDGAAGNRSVIAAGTGLGEAILVQSGSRFLPCATEGGHADFAPRTPEEIGLLEYLRARTPRVSYERVLSGPGLLQIYLYLAQSSGEQLPSAVSEAIASGDAPAVISKRAIESREDLAGRALDLFLSVYGAEAGNFALKTLSTGGVYIGGGIARKILPKLPEGAFLKAFLDKGRMTPLLSGMPVRVILSEQTSLIGAARYALDFFKSSTF